LRDPFPCRSLTFRYGAVHLALHPIRRPYRHGLWATVGLLQYDAGRVLEMLSRFRGSNKVYLGLERVGETGGLGDFLGEGEDGSEAAWRHARMVRCRKESTASQASVPLAVSKEGCRTPSFLAARSMRPTRTSPVDPVSPFAQVVDVPAQRIGQRPTTAREASFELKPDCDARTPTPPSPAKAPSGPPPKPPSGSSSARISRQATARGRHPGYGTSGTTRRGRSGPSKNCTLQRRSREGT